MVLKMFQENILEGFILASCGSFVVPYKRFKIQHPYISKAFAATKESSSVQLNYSNEFIIFE